MIASLSGTIQSKDLSSVVLSAGGVGFQVFVPAATNQALAVNQTATLFTELIVREDAFTMYGFSNSDDRDMFNSLRSVNGVGPKSALSVLNVLDIPQIQSAVSQEDDGAFKVVPGIGPKTAKLIVVTLAGKIGAVTAADKSEYRGEVITALVGLGWSEKLASEAVSLVQSESAPNAHDLLRSALSVLASRKSVGVKSD